MAAASKTTTPASTTVKVATLTGAAKDDVFGVMEDSASQNLNVLANDPGAARIWSLDQNALSAPAGSQMVQNTGAFRLASGAVISLNADGTIRYDASGMSGLQSLAQGEPFTDSFIYTVRMANGALSVANVKVNVVGANDAPTVSGPLSLAASEDGASPALNLLTGASDVDHGAVLSVANLSGLVDGVSVSGNSLSVDAAHQAFQHLGQGKTQGITVSYAVSDEHGAMVNQSALITVTGVNDAPTVGASLTLVATEDASNAVVDLLNGASDVDDDAVLSVMNLGGLVDGVSVSGNSLSVDAAHQAFQHLGQGKTQGITVSYGVSDEHGATVNQSVLVTVTGVNDAPVFGGASSASVQEDGSSSAAGSVSVTDVDDGESAFAGVAAGTSLAGTYGDFTFEAHTGAWTYQLRNGDANVQALSDTDLVSDVLTIASVDGTTTDITVSVSGKNEPVVVPPVVTPPTPEPLNPSVSWMVNNGLSHVNGRVLFTGFDGNDKLKHSNDYTYAGFDTSTDVTGNGLADTVVSFTYETNGKKSHTEILNVVLVDYVGFTAAQFG